MTAGPDLLLVEYIIVIIRNYENPYTMKKITSWRLYIGELPAVNIMTTLQPTVSPNGRIPLNLSAYCKHIAQAKAVMM